MKNIETEFHTNQMQVEYENELRYIETQVRKCCSKYINPPLTPETLEKIKLTLFNELKLLPYELDFIIDKDGNVTVINK